MEKSVINYQEGFREEALCGVVSGVTSWLWEMGAAAIGSETVKRRGGPCTAIAHGVAGRAVRWERSSEFMLWALGAKEGLKWLNDRIRFVF